MQKYADLDKIKKNLSYAAPECLSDPEWLNYQLDKCEVAEVKPTLHARYLTHGYGDYECSNCHYCTHSDTFPSDINYCPHCGAQISVSLCDFPKDFFTKERPLELLEPKVTPPTTLPAGKDTILDVEHTPIIVIGCPLGTSPESFTLNGLPFSIEDFRVYIGSSKELDCGKVGYTVYTAGINQNTVVENHISIAQYLKIQKTIVETLTNPCKSCRPLKICEGIEKIEE